MLKRAMAAGFWSSCDSAGNIFEAVVHRGSWSTIPESASSTPDETVYLFEWMEIKTNRHWI